MLFLSLALSVFVPTSCLIGLRPSKSSTNSQYYHRYLSEKATHHSTKLNSVNKNVQNNNRKSLFLETNDNFGARPKGKRNYSIKGLDLDKKTCHPVHTLKCCVNVLKSVIKQTWSTPLSHSKQELYSRCFEKNREMSTKSHNSYQLVDSRIRKPFRCETSVINCTVTAIDRLTAVRPNCSPILEYSVCINDISLLKQHAESIMHQLTHLTNTCLRISRNTLSTSHKKTLKQINRSAE